MERTSLRRRCPWFCVMKKALCPVGNLPSGIGVTVIHKPSPNVVWPADRLVGRRRSLGGYAPLDEPHHPLHSRRINPSPRSERGRTELGAGAFQRRGGGERRFCASPKQRRKGDQPSYRGHEARSDRFVGKRFQKLPYLEIHIGCIWSLASRRRATAIFRATVRHPAA